MESRAPMRSLRKGGSQLFFNPPSSSENGPTQRRAIFPCASTSAAQETAALLQCLPLNRDAKAELNRRSQVCEVLTGTGVRVA